MRERGRERGSFIEVSTNGKLKYIINVFNHMRNLLLYWIMSNLVAKRASIKVKPACIYVCLIHLRVLWLNLMIEIDR